MAWVRKEKKARQPLTAKLEIPADVWEKCESCGHTDTRENFQRGFNVCPTCDFHRRLRALEYTTMLLDDASIEEAESDIKSVDPLGFPDYPGRLKKARTNAGDADAILTTSGTMDGMPVNLGVMDFAFMGGSMGAAVGEAIVAAAELALLQETPLIIIPSSGGARMQEGILSLMQMARTTVAVSKVREKVLPYITVLTDPTTGGVTASFTMLGDIQIAEPGAEIGFAGARVIEQTVREKLPEGFQRSEYLLAHGILDMVVKRAEMNETLGRLISLLRVKELAPAA